MALYNIDISDKVKAKMISEEFRMFDTIDINSNIKVGDTVHYCYMKGINNVKNKIDKYVYTVTCVERIANHIVFGIKKSALWISHIYETLAKVSDKGRECSLSLYGDRVYDRCTISLYDGDRFILSKKGQSDVWLKVADVVEIKIL